MNNVNEMLSMAANDVNEVFKHFDIDDNIPITVNNRFTRTLGRCTNMFDYEYCEYVPEKIEFSKRFLETATAATIHSVAQHEAIHAVACFKTGESHGHDAYFKSLCKEIGCKNDGTKTKVENIKGVGETAKYIITCRECGEVNGKYYRAGKIIKNIDRYRCHSCHGKLSIIQNY